MYGNARSIHEDLRGQYREPALQLLGEHHVQIWNWSTDWGAAYRRIPRLESLARGAVIREPWISCPREMDEVGFAVLAHEVGHHALGHTLLQRYRLRLWAKETEAWDFAMAQLRRFGIPETEELEDFRLGSVRDVLYRSLASGLQVLPPIFLDYLEFDELLIVLNTARTTPREELPDAIRRRVYEILRDSDI